MAHKRTGGVCKNGRDSSSKRLGIKTYGSNIVKPGYILVRQRGAIWKGGDGVLTSKDYTIIAAIDGLVTFLANKKVVTVKQ
ncbi:MAG: 50S ribosomal protein L27 [Candidatus Hodgkinia cicadicola]